MPVLSRKHQELIARVSKDIRSRGRFERTKYFIQHGNTSVYEHVHQVAALSLWLNEKFRLKADEEMLVRSSLLHDYFLYDWHDGAHDHPRPHGFTHPSVALQEARKDFSLSSREEDAIRRHMFPLTVVPPRHREGWIVTTADKISTYQELRRYQASRKKKKRQLKKK